MSSSSSSSRKRASSDEWEMPGRHRRRIKRTPSPSPSTSASPPPRRLKPKALSRAFRVRNNDDEEQADSLQNTAPTSFTAQTRTSSSSSSRSSNLKPSQVVVTPLVHEIVAPFFPESAFSVEGPIRKPPGQHMVRHLPATSASVASCSEEDFLQEGELWFDRKRVNVRFYNRVLVDDAWYIPGDFVAVEPGLDDQRPRAALYADTEGENPWADLWYARITYIFQNEEELYVHVRWLEHGRKIPLLMEVAHPNALFVLTSPGASCEDIVAESIRHKANVRVLNPSEPEPSIGTWPLHRFFLKYTWNPATAAFEDAQPEFHPGSGIHDLEHRGCVSCQNDATDGELTYHVHDFVYFQSRQPASANATPAYRLGQIQAIVSDTEVEVHILGRHDNVMHALKKCIGQQEFDKNLSKNESRLFLTLNTKVIERDRLAGKFFVHSDVGCDADPKEWFALDNHFWLDMRATTHPVTSLEDLVPISDGDVENCTQCLEEEVARIKNWRQFMLSKKQKPFKGLELFSGCGGLATAFEEVSCHTSWAVERDPSAALTHSKNHPHCVVHTADVNVALRNIISKDSTLGFPAPGDDVDIIFGGPPCQGFSTLNRHRRVGDERNLLFANMLSWVDIYRPDYYLMENVGGMLLSTLESVNKDGSLLVVESGTVKLIVRILTALGYQVRVHYLQAGAWGSPQSRHRLVVLASRTGTKLPMAPPASHAFQGRTKATKKLPGGLQLLLRPELGCAFQGVSLGDAIGDLPAFDWKNPHSVIPATKEDLRSEARRAAKVPPFHVARHGAIGFTEAVDYRRDPLTSFQRRCRGSLRQVAQQHTRTFGSKQVERVCNVPLKKGACHWDVPKPLALSTPKDSQHANKPYARLDFAVPAPIASTQMEIGGSSGQVLHPTQHRCLSVREFARIQGFPDWYQFYTTTGKQQECYRQIGNAVPLPLGIALAKAILQSLFLTWASSQEAPGQSSLVNSAGASTPAHIQLSGTPHLHTKFDIILPVLGDEVKAAYIPMKEAIPIQPRQQTPGVARSQASTVVISPPLAGPSTPSKPSSMPRARHLLLDVVLPVLDAETRLQYKSLS